MMASSMKNHGTGIHAMLASSNSTMKWCCDSRFDSSVKLGFDRCANFQLPLAGTDRMISASISPRDVAKVYMVCRLNGSG